MALTCSWRHRGGRRGDRGGRAVWLSVFGALVVLPPVAGLELSISNPYLERPEDLDLPPPPILLDGTAAGLRYDGHGAVSAGATARLLHDYAEPYRGRILDYLFHPEVGAALHMLKIEIGGDSQSSAGTEPSHMHHRADLSCGRGWELWLLQEARQRNPNLLAYALSWAVPYWVGVQDDYQAGYYDGDDNIDYHVAWLRCAQQQGAGNIDFLGHWNERSWGSPAWTMRLRSALDAAGFNNTRLIIPDGAYDAELVETIINNASLAGAMQGGGIGVHYPCYRPRPEVHEAGLLFWSSEDFDTTGDWAGAGCWGRTLNQNFVRMNITSTLAWPLLWSAYPVLPQQGKGLLLAPEPWSGHYFVGAPVWVTAHTTRFVQVGWTILAASGLDGRTSLGRGSGYLRRGGSYVTYVSPSRDRFALVVEKLHGECAHCGGQTTGPEEVHFELGGGLEEAALVDDWPTPLLCLWATNETHWFQSLGTLAAIRGPHGQTFSFVAYPDSIYTVSGGAGGANGTTAPGCDLPANSSAAASNATSDAAGQQAAMNDSSNATENASANDTNGTNDTISEASDDDLFAWVPPNSSLQCAAAIAGLPAVAGLAATAPPGPSVPESRPFPETYEDDFESYAVDATARYFADFAGSWQVALDPTRSGNRVLKQWVMRQAAMNQWVPDTEPLTIIGDPFTDVSAAVDVYIPARGGNATSSNTTTTTAAPANSSSNSSDNSSDPTFTIGGSSPRSLQSWWSGLCIGVAGKAAWEGVDALVMPCTPAWYTQLSYDTATGQLAVRRITGERLCLASGSACRQSGACFVGCCRSSRESPNCDRQSQAWCWNTDGTVHLLARPADCLAVVDMRPGSVRLTSCTSGSGRQRWLASAAAYDAYAGLCVRLAVPAVGVAERHRGRRGYCLNVGIPSGGGDGIWQLERGGGAATSEGLAVLAQGVLPEAVGQWHRLNLSAIGNQVTAAVDAQLVVSVSDDDYTSGVAALNSGWGEAYFDGFSLARADLAGCSLP